MDIKFEEVFPEYVYSNNDKLYIPLEVTKEFELAFDKLRIGEGKRPLFTETPGLDMDYDGWYEVRLVIDNNTKLPIEAEAWVEGTEPDNTTYHIKIEDKDNIMECVYSELDKRQMTLEEVINAAQF